MIWLSLCLLLFMFGSFFPSLSIYRWYYFRGALPTDVGVKLSIESNISIVSTQVAPLLHHLHKKEGQLDTFLIGNYSILFTI
jgi:hypothetical protein